MSASHDPLRQRFMAALARQAAMLVPTTDNESCYDVAIFSINDPFVATEDGDYYMAWCDSRVSKDWLYSVHDSGHHCIIVNANLVHDGMTDDNLDVIARDGGFRITGTDGESKFYQVYLRVC